MRLNADQSAILALYCKFVPYENCDEAFLGKVRFCDKKTQRKGRNVHFSDHRRTTKLSRSLRRMFVALRFSSCTSRSVSPNGGLALAIRGAFRQTSVWLLHFAERFAKRRFVSCTSQSVSPNVEVSPATCLGLSPLGEDLLQPAGDVRSPTMISCNLREMFVALQ